MLDIETAKDFANSYNSILRGKQEEGYLELSEQDLQRGATFVLAVVVEDEPTIAQFMESTITEMEEGSPFGEENSKKVLQWSRQLYFFTLLKELSKDFKRNRKDFALPEVSVKAMSAAALDLGNPAVEGALNRAIESLGEFTEKGFKHDGDPRKG